MSDAAMGAFGQHLHQSTWNSVRSKLGFPTDPLTLGLEEAHHHAAVKRRRRARQKRARAFTEAAAEVLVMQDAGVTGVLLDGNGAHPAHPLSSKRRPRPLVPDERGRPSPDYAEDVVTATVREALVDETRALVIVVMPAGTPCGTVTLTFD